MAIAAGLAGLSLFGSGIQALGQLNAGLEAERTAEINEWFLRRDASLVAIREKQDLFDANRRIELLRGSQVGISAGSGTTTGGSVAAILAESAVLGAIEKARIEHNASVAIQGLNIQADQVKRAGKQAKKQSRLAALGTVLGGSASALRAFQKAGGNTTNITNIIKTATEDDTKKKKKDPLGQEPDFSSIPLHPLQPLGG